MGSRARRHDQLRIKAVERLRRGGDVDFAGLCRRVPQFMAELLEARVSVCFIDIRGSTGGTALCSDGTYIVYCANSPSWIHRGQVLFHELAHLLLEHKPVELDSEEGLRRFMPDLPDGMITLIASRTDLTAAEERDAEILADGILEALTETPRRSDADELAKKADHIRRIADALEDHHHGERR